jgi:hypothetical protein
MASIVTSGVAPGKLPHESGYVHGFVTLGAATAAAALAGLLVPTMRRRAAEDEPELLHAEMALVAGGTILGDEPE